MCNGLPPAKHFCSHFSSDPESQYSPFPSKRRDGFRASNVRVGIFGSVISEVLADSSGSAP